SCPICPRARAVAGAEDHRVLAGATSCSSPRCRVLRSRVRLPRTSRGSSGPCSPTRGRWSSSYGDSALIRPLDHRIRMIYTEKRPHFGCALRRTRTMTTHLTSVEPLPHGDASLTRQTGAGDLPPEVFEMIVGLTAHPFVVIRPDG